MASLLGLVLLPNWQLGLLEPIESSDPQGVPGLYPAALDDFDQGPGREVYKAQGCIYCHSQQVRADTFGADVQRNWGERRSVPRDYLLQSPPLLGTMRTGPDLANVGARQPADAWHHLHLFDPRLVTEGSIMPPFSYLYDITHHNPGARGYRLLDHYSDSPTWIVPKVSARHLVAYLKSLHQDHSLDEVQ